MCSIFLIKLQHHKTAAFGAKYQLKKTTVTILNCVSFNSFAALWTQKVNVLNKQCIFIGIMICFVVLKATTHVRMLSVSIDIGPQSFCHSFIALPKITLFQVSSEIHSSGVSSCYCCMDTMQLVLSQLKNFLAYELRIV